MSTTIVGSSSSSSSQRRPNNADNDDDQDKRILQTAPLAFSSDPSLVSATSRLGVPTVIHQRTSWINVEVFEPTPTSSSIHNNNNNNQNNATMPSSLLPLVIFIPGLCESAETKTVQEMAVWAKTIHVRLAVLELPGHGLLSSSTSSRGQHSRLLDLPHEDIRQVVKQVLEAIRRILTLLMGSTTTATTEEEYGMASSSASKIPYVLSGSSFGATVALYAAEYISRQMEVRMNPMPGKEDSTTTAATKQAEQAKRNPREESIVNDDDLWKDFFATRGTLAGVVAVSPAVGIHPTALPPPWIVSTLSVASALVPGAQVPFTPYEDSAQYDCPATTTRNFKGRWPLAISKFLLDVTSQSVPQDVANHRLTLKHIPKVLLLVGAKDGLIPLELIRAVEAHLQSPMKQVVVLPKVGHDVLMNPKSSSKALELLFGALLPTTSSPS
jgi:pimeloyl-ACP methyl ester carboxylesterase